jgi:hypothetical protein
MPSQPRIGTNELEFKSGEARGSRAGDGVLAIANFSLTLISATFPNAIAAYLATLPSMPLFPSTPFTDG